MLTYKALNTFIDDLFAFVIKMPTLYRLGCFRDGAHHLNLTSFLVKKYLNFCRAVCLPWQRVFATFSDIVFLIFLYQRYIYRVDPKRVNEFGTSQETWEQNGPAAGEEEETTQEAIENTADKTAQEKKEDWFITGFRKIVVACRNVAESSPNFVEGRHHCFRSLWTSWHSHRSLWCQIYEGARIVVTSRRVRLGSKRHCCR